MIISTRVFARAMSASRAPRGAVVTNAPHTAGIGAAILARGGSVVDAGIAALLAEGVSLPNSMGLGGGFLANVYIKNEGVVATLDAREVAPGGACEDMFCGDSSLSSRGGLAVAVPGELKGYWELYNKYGGKIPWKDLVQPAIDLCNDGVTVTKYLERTFQSAEVLLSKDELLRECFINPINNKPLLCGDCFRRPCFAKTLQLIAKCGADVLYDGQLTKNFVQDIRDNCGIITVEDMNNYKVKWRSPIQTDLPCGQTLHTSPLPSCGLIISLILNILSNFLNFSCPSSISNWHRIIESFKFGFGRRTELGDPCFEEMELLVAELTSESYAKELRAKISDDRTCPNVDYYGAGVKPTGRGTANVCILAPNGDAFVATSTINLDFGAGFVSRSTGIILNNEMDDFSSPTFANSYHLLPSAANYIKPGKRPLSSMCPSIVLDNNCNVRMIIGAAGGPKIITSVALTIIRNLWFRIPIHKALAEKRLHHQLFPMLIEFEEPFRNEFELVEALQQLGHDCKLSKSAGFSAVTAITQCNGIINGSFDPRRGGEIACVY